MKFFYLSLLVVSSLSSNIFLQRPQKLSRKQIEELAKNWETQFTWPFGKLADFTCYYKAEQSSFTLKLAGICIKSYNYSFSNFKNFAVCPGQNLRDYYFAKPLQVNQPNPKKIEFNKICSLLINKKFIFYTGAGISALGKVATMSNLEKSLNLNQGILNFLKKIFFESKSLTIAFDDFCKSAINGLPTPAHYSLYKICNYRGVCILTENVDLLQQRTGIMPLFIHSDSLDNISDQDLKDVEILICVGLSRDDCGFIAYYKEKNPNGVILAIDLGLPSYLSERDYLAQEDLQILLPKLADFLCN